MAYGQLDSPLPGLTVRSDGERCCGMRGLGDDSLSFDTTSTDNFGELTDPTTIFDPLSDPTLQNLPLAPSITPLESSYPSSIGTEFILQGPNEYLNIQTGQVVPMQTAQAITAATTGPATSNLDTVATGQGPSVTIVDPNTGSHSTIATNNLTAAAQALNSAGQLVNAAGKLTAQGQALLNAGNLYNTLNPPSSAGLNLSSAVSSLTSWFSAETLIAGIPNGAVALGGVAIVALLPALLSGKKGRRR